MTRCVFILTQIDSGAVGSAFGGISKRSMEFMGMRVSYPQYVRLKAIQREVIKMDQERENEGARRPS